MSSPIGAFISGCAGLSLSPAEEQFFARTNPFGLILFKRNCQTPAQLKALTGAFRAAVGRRNAPVFVDQEGGRVQRLGPPSDSWPKYPPARAYGEAYGRCRLTGLRAARNLGRLMAEDLIEAGITANCVPVLDVPQPGAHEIIGSRAYSDGLEPIMALARAHAAGFADGGVLPVIKHIPGHGRAMSDSHLELPQVGAGVDTLRASDFAPFRAFCRAPARPVAFGMTAHVVYTAIDPEQPATTSRRMIEDVVRGEIGFDGLLMSDDLGMKALAGPFDERAARSLAAGCDVVLHCDGNLADMEAVARGTGPLGPRGMKALGEANAIRRRPRASADGLAVADFQILDALRG